MGDRSEFDQYINELQEQGVSKEDATRQAVKEFFIIKPGFAGLGGVISGGVMAGGVSAVNSLSPPQKMPNGQLTPNGINAFIENADTSGINKLSMADFRDVSSPVWTSIDYNDNTAKAAITNKVSNEMTSGGDMVIITKEDLDALSEYYPDLRIMKKSERNPILKENIRRLKNILKTMLETDFKGKDIEFNVNGNILEAKLYDTGIKEVLEKITKNKAAMLNKTGEIFDKARYLYSTEDKINDPNIYRWNYFYVPLNIEGETQGVRIAVRDMVKTEESQIYNWKIKKEAGSPNGPGTGYMPSGLSDGPQPASFNTNIPQGGNGVNNIISKEAGNNTGNLGQDKVNTKANEAGETPAFSMPKNKENIPVAEIKDSKFAESVEDSALIDETAKILAKDNNTIQKYEAITNADTLETAAARLQKGQKEIDRIRNIDPKQATTADISEAFVLMDYYQSKGDYENMIAFMEKARQMGTSTAQSLQLFSILGRLSPDSMLYYSQKTLSGAYDILSDGKSQEWIDKNKDKFKLTEEDISFINERMEKAMQLPDGRDKRILLGEISARVQNKIPPTTGQSIKALARISMLLNPKTNVRNILGNVIITPLHIADDFIGAGIDKAIATKTGVRTTGGLKPISTLKGFKKGGYGKL